MRRLRRLPWSVAFCRAIPRQRQFRLSGWCENAVRSDDESQGEPAGRAKPWRGRIISFSVLPRRTRCARSPAAFRRAVACPVETEPASGRSQQGRRYRRGRSAEGRAAKITAQRRWRADRSTRTGFPSSHRRGVPVLPTRLTHTHRSWQVSRKLAEARSGSRASE